MPVFEKLRLSLLREEPGDLLTRAEYVDDVRPRSDFIVSAFSSERVFLHKDSRISFSPLQMPEGYVGGFFTRERPVPLKHDDLSTYDAENFEGLLVICSTDQDQNIWAEKNPKVAGTKSLLESFFGFLLKSTELNDYQALLRYVDSRQVYWEVIREHQHEITSIAFTFIPPNSLDADDEIYNLIKEIQGEANPDTQEHRYKSKRPGQMNLESPHLVASAKIAMKGGGEAAVRSFTKLLYSSKSEKSRTTEDIMIDDMPTPEHPHFVKGVITRLFRK